MPEKSIANLFEDNPLTFAKTSEVNPIDWLGISSGSKNKQR
jgi:hypothetical protein